MDGEIKEGRTSINEEPRHGRPSDVNTPEKLQAVNDLILAERRITVEEIAQALDISTGTAHHIIPVKCSNFPRRAIAGYLRCSRLSTSKTALTFPGNSLIGFTEKERPSCSESSLGMKHGPSTMSLG